MTTLESLTTADKNDVESMVPFCILERCADSSKTKLTVSMTAFPHRSVLIAGLHQIVGVASAGYLENELQCWTDYLTSDK